MQGGGMQQMAPHKPTLGWSIAAVVIVVLGYHFLLGKGRRK